MRIATIDHEGRPRVGRASADGAALELFDTDGAHGALGLVEAVGAGAPWPAVTQTVPLAGVRFLAALPRPRRGLFCVGRNYRAHADELRATVFKTNAAAVDVWPIVFTKMPECVVATGTAVRLPGEAVSSQIDYEAELAVVIGRGGRDIARADARAHVFGYVVVNDVTARDVQMRHGQWDLGKSFDTFCPMGPWLATADEVDGRDTRVRCWVTPRGGVPELRQDASTRDLVFDIPTLIETCSRGITLHPGDVIATGTPAGVGMGFDPPRWLRHGDRVRIEIDGVGDLDNEFVEDGR